MTIFLTVTYRLIIAIAESRRHCTNLPRAAPETALLLENRPEQQHCTLAPLSLKALSPYLTTTEEPQTKKKLRTESKDNLSNNTASGRDSTREEIPPWVNPGPVKGRGRQSRSLDFLKTTVGEVRLEKASVAL